MVASDIVVITVADFQCGQASFRLHRLGSLHNLRSLSTFRVEVSSPIAIRAFDVISRFGFELFLSVIRICYLTVHFVHFALLIDGWAIRCL